MTAGNGSEAPRAATGGLAARQLVLTWSAEPGAEPAVDMATCTLADVYAAAMLLDMIARELRMVTIQQRVAERQASTLAVARSFPGAGVRHDG